MGMIESFAKTLFDNATFMLSGPLGCAPLKEPKFSKDGYVRAEDVKIDSKLICDSLGERNNLSFESKETIDTIIEHCLKSCQPIMRSVPVMASIMPPEVDKEAEEKAEKSSDEVAASSPKTEEPPELVLSAVPAAAYNDPADVIREINAILSKGYRADPYDDPSNFRNNPYGADDVAEPASTDGATQPGASLESPTANPYADEPITAVRSSVAPDPIEAIALGAATEANVNYEPFFSQYQYSLCSCFDRIDTDTLLDVKICIRDAEQFK